jgi:hypothetical protein
MLKPKKLVYVIMAPTVAKNIFKPRAVFTDKQKATDILAPSEYLEAVYLNTEKEQK